MDKSIKNISMARAYTDCLHGGPSFCSYASMDSSSYSFYDDHFCCKLKRQLVFVILHQSVKETTIKRIWAVQLIDLGPYFQITEKYRQIHILVTNVSLIRKLILFWNIMKFLVHQIYSKEGTFHPEFVSSCNQIELSTKFVMLKKFQSEYE